MSELELEAINKEFCKFFNGLGVWENYCELESGFEAGWIARGKLLERELLELREENKKLILIAKKLLIA